MMRISVVAILIFLISMVPLTFAASDQGTQTQIEILQAQIKAMQMEHQRQMEAVSAQLDLLKEEVVAQGEDSKGRNLKIAELEEGAKSWIERGFGSGTFKLRDAMNLDEESRLNIAGELNFRYRNNIDEDVLTDQGFQFYEIELFLDAAVNDFTSIFVEYPISHKNYLNPGNSWIDFHWPGELAASEYTGLMIGNFTPKLGYLNYDDNQSWVYGGRTTTNTTIIRGKTIDSQVIRNRQIGISAPIRLGSFLFEPQIYNGSGPIEFSGGSDNDRRMDFYSRVQYTMPNELGLIGAGYGYLPKTKGATANTAGTRNAGSGATHVRDIERYAVYFRYPDVSQATLPDFSLGGKPFMLYGEYIWGVHHPNFTVSGMEYTQDFIGWYLETDVNIIRDKLVGILRYDYFDPDTDVSRDTLMGITPALKWAVWPNTWLTTEYEHYFGKENASGKDDDKIAFELAVWF